MKRFMFGVLMAVLVIPVMQADGPESFMMHRGSKAKSHATLVKSEKFGAKHRMSKGSTYWDFEDASQLDDWTFVDNDGDGFNWEYHNNYGLEYGLMSCFSGDGMMRSLSYSLEESSVLFPDNWMISPIVELGGTLRFWSRGQDPVFCQEVFAVYVCVGDPTDLDNFIKISPDYKATDEYLQYKFDLTPYQGQMGCFAIRHYNVSDMFMLNIDDVWLDTNEVCVPDPTTPENLTVVPTAETALVSWVEYDDSRWNLRYREYHHQYFWIFDSSAGADDWITIDADGDGYNWNIGPQNGNIVFYSESDHNGMYLRPDDWLISPEVPLNGELLFRAKSFSPQFFDNFAVYVTTGDVNDISSYVLISSELIAAPYDETQFIFDLGQFGGQMGHFAIRHYDSNDLYGLSVDNILLNLPGEEPFEWNYVYDLNATNCTIEGLTPETNYEVQVQALNNNNVESSWTESVLFTTLAGELPPITPAPNMNFGEEIDDNGLNHGIVVIEPIEGCDIYYRIGVSDDNGEWVFGDWMEYLEPINFNEPGYYQIEAYAITDGSEESPHVIIFFVFSYNPTWYDQWLILKDKNGNLNWNKLEQDVDGNYVTTVTLDYATYGGYRPGIDPVRQVSFYYMLDGDQFGADEPMKQTQLGNALVNPLELMSGNDYTLPVGYTYTLGVTNMDGYYYVFAAQGTKVDGNPADYADDVTSYMGDADGDGVITITDVVRIIDYILSPDDTIIDLYGADCNNDGVVSISDAVALIDYILYKTW